MVNEGVRVADILGVRSRGNYFRSGSFLGGSLRSFFLGLLCLDFNDRLFLRFFDDRFDRSRYGFFHVRDDRLGRSFEHIYGRRRALFAGLPDFIKSSGGNSGNGGDSAPDPGAVPDGFLLVLIEVDELSDFHFGFLDLDFSFCHSELSF